MNRPLPAGACLAFCHPRCHYWSQQRGSSLSPPVSPITSYLGVFEHSFPSAWDSFHLVFTRPQPCLAMILQDFSLNVTSNHHVLHRTLSYSAGNAYHVWTHVFVWLSVSSRPLLLFGDLHEDKGRAVLVSLPAASRASGAGLTPSRCPVRE